MDGWDEDLQKGKPNSSKGLEKSKLGLSRG
jgi:hypothetical protein